MEGRGELVKYRRERAGSRGKRAMAHGVISKLGKIKQGRRHNDCRYASDVLIVVFGRCWGKGKMMYRERAKWI